MIISCDGGAASGKTTGAKMISKKYKLKFLSSGMLYRYASYIILKNKPKNNILFLKKKFKKLNLKKVKKLNLNAQIISDHTSKIAKIKKLEIYLKLIKLIFQRRIKIALLKEEIFLLKYCLTLMLSFILLVI